MDISGLLSGYGVQLEQKAVNIFGAAVGDYARQSGLGALGDLATNAIRNGGSVSSVDGVLSELGLTDVDTLLGNGQGQWQSPTYASDLVSYAPKHRFIFKVQFVFNDPYNRINREFMYVVKEIDKPTVVFEYEDVNMYNFRTKVLKAIRHEPLNMVFHDDIQNKVLDFFNAYRVAYSPISSLTYNEAHLMEDMGMDFYQPGTGGRSSASMGLLENGQINVLNHIKVTQVYAHGTRQNVFVFTNPRIEHFDFDNLTHDGGEGNSLSVSFNYDALYLYDTQTSGTPEPRWGKADILGNSQNTQRSSFGNLIGGDSGGFGSSIPSFANNFMGGSLSSAFPNISSSISGVVSSATSELDSLRSSALSAIDSSLSSVKASAGGIAASIDHSVAGMINSAKEEASDIYDEFSSWF